MRNPTPRGALVFQRCPGLYSAAAISKVYAGWNGLPINHVGVSLGDGTLIEAIPQKGVSIVHENEFWNRGEELYKNGPIGLIGNLVGEHRVWIEPALAWMIGQLSKPYNDAFDARLDHFYCSQLACEAFKHAAGYAVLPESPMNFKDPETGQFLAYWVQFYQNLDLEIPQGQSGSHPAVLSLSDRLNIETVF